jgi:cell division protein FtsI/penicillin-binding protein 2
VVGRPTRRAPRARTVAVAAFILAAWVGVGLRLFEIQVVSADEYADRGVEQRLVSEVMAADRGTIFDRDGHELAVSISAVTVYANPQQVADAAATASLVGPLAGVDPAALQERLSGDSAFAYVARQLERADADRIAALELPGLYFTEEPARIYPSGSLGAHVLGFVRTDDNEGLEGVEYAFNDLLRGRPGELLVERAASGGVIIPLGEYAVVPPQRGGDLVLTIDREIQFQAESSLARAVEAWGALGGSVVVLDPVAGEILAMANLPTFDPNEFGTAEPDSFRNRAVVDVYEPGSTHKLVTVAAALNEGVVRPADSFEVPPELVIDDKTYGEVGGRDSVATLTVSDIVTHSSNVGTILIQQKLGNEALHRYMEAFGLGQPSGVGFPGEAAGRVYPLVEWCPNVCGASTAIGYRVSVTALQMASVFGAIANDGVWVQPRLIKELVDANGEVTMSSAGSRRVVSAETAAAMRVMLAGVVEEGTGTAAAIEGYRVGGKTGTTEKFNEAEGRYTDAVVASFVGFAPVDNPRVVIAVTIDSPAGGEFGGEVAAPVVGEIALSTLHQLGVPPDE